ncbi:Zn(2)-C6 fungal-type transcriptional factor [Mycena sanguinolenta]|uniref:Zn(2)-C6 fungal-type transcriptional factor n=1 Tax=Mycena sanguinolenta TaxID=230812 RepID=A0A8H6ZA99_9AGAR|nr:Zn(2)-C6 fungal-type transcriptional factor [Mycena sanguinolenta]
MPTNRSPILHSQEMVKRKKPPACDSCKARRVLCHPTTDGSPCPRCFEKGTKCTTTPVARGRPPKPNLGIAPSGTPEPVSASATTSESASEEPETMSSSNSIIPSRLELPPELVHHLFECFTHLPIYNHPMLLGDDLRETLSAVSWQIQLLPPQLKVLAHCIAALSASISFDHAIIGPGSKPASLADRSVFIPGADLRDYGVRRTPMYRALCAEALRLASEAGIYLEPSEANAGSCFVLQLLENDKDARSRPWAVAYFSHIRALYDSSPNMRTHNVAIWTGFLLMDVMETTLRRQPILVSHHDQLLITGKDIVSLENLYGSIQSMMQVRKEQPLIPFAAMRPYMFHVTRLARELYETITGDFARRHPLDERAITEFIASLNHLHSIRSLVFDQEEQVYPGDSLFSPADSRQRGVHLNLRSCAYIMAFSRATLVLGLHRELVRRFALSPPPLTTAPPVEHWKAERLALLRRQVGEMADLTVEDIARSLRLMPSLPHLAHVQLRAVLGWAEFCLDEADAKGSVTRERAATIETISEALKLIGYSWPLPTGLIERLDGYVATHRSASANPLSFSTFSGDSMFVDMFPAPLDNNWMSVFTAPSGMGNETENEVVLWEVGKAPFSATSSSWGAVLPELTPPFACSKRVSAWLFSRETTASGGTSILSRFPIPPQPSTTASSSITISPSPPTTSPHLGVETIIAPSDGDSVVTYANLNGDAKGRTSAPSSVPWANSTAAGDALSRYINLYNTQFPFLDDGFNLPDPVPEDILLSWADFMAKFDLDAASFSVYQTNQGVGNEMTLPAIYAMKYFSSLTAGGDLGIGPPFITTANFNNQGIYDKALNKLGQGEGAFLSAAITRITRTDDGVAVVMHTPDGKTTTINAKQLVLAIPPVVADLRAIGLDLSPEEENPLRPGELQPDGIPTSDRMVLRVGKTGLLDGVPGLKLLDYSSTSAISDADAQADILATLAKYRAANGLDASVEPVFAGFNNHEPYELTVPVDAIRNGYYKKRNALQGRQNTWYTGAAWQAHDSTLIWNFTETAVVEKVVKVLCRGGKCE